MVFDGIIFDIDGTLWDSCEAVRASWQESLRWRFGCFGSPDLAQVRSIMGLGPDEIAQKLFSRFGAHAREVFAALSVDECAWLSAHGAELYPAVIETLRALARERRLFLVSNCQDGYIDAFLHANAAEDLFEDCLCAGVTGLDKSGNLQRLKRERGLAHAVFIGDTAGDERAARESGCVFIHASYGFGEAEAPDAVLGSFAALPALLTQLEKEA
ncbi:MAG: HAD family hydrolase [Oscillospiraceae bacterium]|nr:HAD family hydrolase [Oscillospiraceae bacterium]